MQCPVSSYGTVSLGHIGHRLIAVKGCGEIHLLYSKLIRLHTLPRKSRAAHALQATNMQCSLQAQLVMHETAVANCHRAGFHTALHSALQFRSIVRRSGKTHPLTRDCVSHVDCAAPQCSLGVSHAGHFVVGERHPSAPHIHRAFHIPSLSHN